MTLTPALNAQLDDQPICVSFTVQRWYPVANLTRYIPARVYDYYAPGQSAYAASVSSDS